LNNHNKHEMV